MCVCKKKKKKKKKKKERINIAYNIICMCEKKIQVNIAMCMDAYACVYVCLYEYK